MSNIEHRYVIEEDRSANNLRFFFISKGHQEIIKVIQYTYLQKLYGKDVYNLGFGDYDLANNSIIDNVNTNNGDAYKVFNTVLASILIFFKNYHNSILMVQGSDGGPEFIRNCRLTCSKKCSYGCKNYNRRINVYKAYINKNYKQLNADYQFIGGIANDFDEIILQPYEPHQNYESVFLFLKSLNFIQ
jgi:hypothetical protein